MSIAALIDLARKNRGKVLGDVDKPTPLHFETVSSSSKLWPRLRLVRGNFRPRALSTGRPRPSVNKPRFWTSKCQKFDFLVIYGRAASPVITGTRPTAPHKGPLTCAPGVLRVGHFHPNLVCLPASVRYFNKMLYGVCGSKRKTHECDESQRATVRGRNETLKTPREKVQWPSANSGANRNNVAEVQERTVASAHKPRPNTHTCSRFENYRDKNQNRRCEKVVGELKERCNVVETPSTIFLTVPSSVRKNHPSRHGHAKHRPLPAYPARPAVSCRPSAGTQHFV